VIQLSTVRVIVAEKDPVAKRIACALCEDQKCKEEQECSHEHIDIFIHYAGLKGCSKMHENLVPCAITPREHSPFYFKCTPETCSTYVASTNRDGNSHSKRIWKRIRNWKKTESDKNKKRIIPEQVKYFEFDENDVKTIVVATNGTILDQEICENNQKPHGNLSKKISDSVEWKTISQSLHYCPDKKHFQKWDLLKALFVEDHFGEVDELFFATDYDIAGSYIALSILEEVNRKREAQEKRGFPLSCIKRLLLKKLTPEEIQRELANPQSFDWGNAFGGKLRNTVDYLFGTPLTHILKRHLRRGLQRKKISEKLDKIGIGRVRFPALKFIINRDWEAAKERFMYKIYLLFKGFNTVAEVHEAIENQNFSAFLIKERKSHYSQSQFIKDLATNKVGTHTTRLKIIEILERGGLIRIDGQKRIRGTRLGLQFYNLLRSRLCTDSYDFASIEFNNQLYDDIDAFKFLDQKIKDNDELFKECQTYFDEIMQFYYNHIREIVLKFERNAKEITHSMANLLLDFDEPQEKTSSSPQINYSSESTVVIEGDNPVDIEKVKKESGSFEHLKNIERKFKKLDLNSHLRLLLQIPRENNFQILGFYNADALIAMNEDNIVLFRASLEDGLEMCKKIFKNVIQDVIEGVVSPSSVEQIETLEFKKRIELAHEPLHTTNLQYRNVEGKKGKCLIMEYDRPYLQTLKQLVYFKMGLVKAFNLGKLRFEVVDAYEFFEAHNFESMLFIMHEKYGFALDETAKMMQDLYLGGGK
jgi:DNA topoisomerase IA